MVASFEVSIAIHCRRYLTYLSYFMILFMLLSCEEVSEDAVVKHPNDVDSIAAASRLAQTSVPADSMASIQYSIINDRFLEIQVKNNFSGTIALIPTLYELTVMNQGHIKTTAASIGAIVYWDTATAEGGVFEVIEPSPRYSSDLPVTVVEIAKGQSVKIQFPIEMMTRKLGNAKRSKLLLEYLPIWEVTDEFRRRLDRSCIVNNRNVIRMCSSDTEASGSTYKVCGANDCPIASRELYYWLRSQVLQVPAMSVVEQ